MTPSSDSPDLFIVGAGPAGLATAIAAASRGLRVEVADSRKPPIDKACGEGLLPNTLAALVELGIDQEHLEKLGQPLQGIRFIKRHFSTEAPFHNGHGLGIRRTALHQLLVHRALALGVRFRWQTVVTGVRGNHVQTNHKEITTHWIVGADGPQSRIRTLAGLDKLSSGHGRVGLRQHFNIAPWTTFVEVYWADRTQAYVTPISTQEVCVAFIGSQRFAGVQRALSRFPALERRLGSALVNGYSSGAITLSRRLHHVTSGNIALVGDASGSVDAITGEGLALCFRQAIALADALSSSNLASYEKAHAHLLRLPFFMSRSMLLMDRYPLALSRAFRAFERKPTLFPHLLSVHTGHHPLHLLGSGGVLATLCCFLAP